MQDTNEIKACLLQITKMLNPAILAQNIFVGSSQLGCKDEK